MVFFHAGKFNTKCENRSNMKKIALIWMVLLVCSGNVFADSLQVGVTASGDTVVGNVEYQKQQSYGIIAVGGGLAYSKNDYTIGEGLVALRSDRLLPGLRYGLGFKGLYGNVDEEYGRWDGTLAAVGFQLDVEYELSPSINPIQIPIEVYTGGCVAPKPLAFQDTEKYFDYKVGVRFYLLESAYVSVEGKYRKMYFEDNTHGEWDRDDTMVVAGLSLRM
jgi:hypothetical protein